jgi:hypothetical protein
MSDPHEPTIILINRALAFNGVGKLSGWSGVQYADSSFEQEHNAHVIRLPLSRWREIKQDVTAGFARRACQWEVDVEEFSDLKSENPKHTAESLAGITNYRKLLSFAKKAGVANAEEINTTEGLREAILAAQLQPA